jgi:hypothetical protein
LGFKKGALETPSPSQLLLTLSLNSAMKPACRTWVLVSTCANALQITGQHGLIPPTQVGDQTSAPTDDASARSRQAASALEASARPSAGAVALHYIGLHFEPPIHR